MDIEEVKNTLWTLPRSMVIALIITFLFPIVGVLLTIFHWKDKQICYIYMIVTGASFLTGLLLHILI